jgi:hypothetical protein
MEALRLLLLSPLPAGEWTEKCLVAFTLLLSRSVCSDSMRIANFQSMIEVLERRGIPPITTRAAHAIVIVRQDLIMVNKNS